MQALQRLGVTGSTLVNVIFGGFVGVAGLAFDAGTAWADTLLETQGSLSSVDAVLDDGSRYDQYTFSGSSGQQVVISLDSTDFDPYLILLDPQGRRIGENDDISRSNRNAQLVVVLPATGSYTVVANSYESGQNGRYAITINVQDGSSTTRQEMAIAAVPGGTSLCHATVLNTVGELESEREVATIANAVQLRDRYTGVPSNRAQGIQLDLQGSAAMSILFSPQLLNYFARELVRDCRTVGAVFFRASETDFERAFGILDEKVAQGRIAEAAVGEFACAEALPDREQAPPTVLPWGQRMCL